MTHLNRRQLLAAGAGLGASLLLPRSLFAEDLAPVNSVNSFALSLYGELRAEKGNVFCSPYSISTALAMTAAGAKGNTLDQMQKVLHLPKDAGASDAAYTKIAKGLAAADKSVQLAVANALWAQIGTPWSNDYKKRVTDTFHAGIHDVNYPENPEEARKKINDWVEKQTKEKIKDLMPEGSIDGGTRLVLTNAIYFKGDWLDAFNKKWTRDQPFTKLDGTKKNVPLMHRTGDYDYFANDDVTVVRLPYKGKEISFLGVLPKKAEAFEAMEKNLNSGHLQDWSKGLKPAHDVQVYLPRFKVETRYILNDTLIKMGMPDAFMPKADFSGMVTSGSPLVISIVVHKAFVDVNEEGTEAAAATGVGMKLAGPPRREEPKIFRADRPFLFALRHEPTGTILFMGRYSNPG